MDGVLTYTINGQDRKFVCRTYATGKVCKQLGITLSQLLEGGYFSADMNVGDLQEVVVSFIFHSAVAACHEDSKPVDFTEYDVYKWIDADGGFGGALYTQFQVLIISQLGLRPAGPEETPQKLQKKRTAKS